MLPDWNLTKGMILPCPCICVDIETLFPAMKMTTDVRNTGFVDDWQTGKTVTECNLHMLTTENFSDVIFRVGSEKHVVKAHRYVLVSRSCVFDAMFCGPLAEKGEITIPDIEHHIFQEFLRYVYTDHAAITAENVTGLLYTSRKYAVDSLRDMCTSYLDCSLTEDNVCHILEQSHGYGDVDLEQKALSVLKDSSGKVLQTSGFLSLSFNNLKDFLQSDNLSMNEEDLYEAVMSWVQERCKEEEVDPNPENVRKAIGELRYELRYTNMSGKYLVRSVGPSGILDDKERLLIMDSMVDPEVDVFPFKRQCRNTGHSVSKPLADVPEVEKWQYSHLF